MKTDPENKEQIIKIHSFKKFKSELLQNYSHIYNKLLHLNIYIYIYIYIYFQFDVEDVYRHVFNKKTIHK